MSVVVSAEHHVVSDVHGADKSHSETVLRNEGQVDPEIPDLCRILCRKVDPDAVRRVVHNGTFRCLFKSRDRL